MIRTFVRSKYSKILVNHFEKPKNVGKFDKNAENVGTAIVGAPACGDVMKLQIKVCPQTNIIKETKFKTFGCGSAIASSSYATEIIKEMHLDEAFNISAVIEYFL